MTDVMAAIRTDPRKRNLAILGGLTLLFLVLAVVAVFQQAASLAPKFDPRPFFPGLGDRLAQLGEITITSKSGSFHVRLQNANWVVVERDSFPADPAQLRAVAVGMAELQMVEPKTARADWLNFLGLGAPDAGGDGVVVRLADTSGMAMAELLAGNTQNAGDEFGPSTLYVRRPNENQSWMARGSLQPKPNAADWLDRNILAIARDRVKGATVTPVSGPAYNLARDNKDQPDFKLLDMPQGRELSFEGSPDGVGGAIVGFIFDDIAKADQFDFTRAPQSVSHTFDGLDITVKIATKAADRWAVVSAAGTNPMAQMEAQTINARVGGWAFKLPDEKVQQFIATRETLLKPAG